MGPQIDNVLQILKKFHVVVSEGEWFDSRPAFPKSIVITVPFGTRVFYFVVASHVLDGELLIFFRYVLCATLKNSCIISFILSR